ncbi:hypothetical protein ACOSQ2_026950 [Xanthoceras sorbifolium]
MRFFIDAYDLFCITLVMKLLGHIYFHKDGSYTLGSLPDNVTAAFNGIVLCGTLAGQLFFVWLESQKSKVKTLPNRPKMGRKSAYGMTFMFVVICSIASGLSFGKDPKAVMATLCDYPLSATITSECTNKKTRGAFIADAFAMEGFGILACGRVAIIASAAFNVKFPAQFMRLIAFDQLCLKLIIFGV